jgi:hypothetical protein
MQDETAGWLQSISKKRNSELAGLAMVGPHVADMVENRVFAFDPDAGGETLAGGPAPDSTHSGAAGGAGVIALGRFPSSQSQAPGSRMRSLSTYRRLKLSL